VICTACGTPNPAGMRFCGMCGTELARQMTARERRRVSVVFVDLAAFSTLTFDLDPEELRDLADEVLTGVASVIEAYDGYVDAFQGDGLIALFGAPHSHPDDPQRAVMAAAAGLRAIEEIGRARGTPLQGRAGVNTGIVIAGAVGSGRVRSYTVMGSAVNLAARLEEAAVPGEVWVGPETFEATRHRLLYEPTEPLELNGFPNVTRAYRLVVGQAQQQPDPYGHLGFVGRESELAALHAAYDEVVTSRAPREVWLVGEAGRGKTRLLREFLRRLDARAAAYWIESRPTEEFRWMPLAQQVFGLQGRRGGALRRAACATRAGRPPIQRTALAARRARQPRLSTPQDLDAARTAQRGPHQRRMARPPRRHRCTRRRRPSVGAGRGERAARSAAAGVPRAAAACEGTDPGPAHQPWSQRAGRRRHHPLDAAQLRGERPVARPSGEPHAAARRAVAGATGGRRPGLRAGAR